MTKEDLKHLKKVYNSVMERLSGLGEKAFGYVTGEPLCEVPSDEELEAAANDTSWREHKDIKLFR